MSGVGELGTDLVGPAGDQLALHQRKPLAAGQDLVAGLAAFGTGLGGIRHEYPVFLGVLEQIALQCPLLRLGGPLHNGQIPLVQLPVFDLLVHHPQGLGGLGRNDDASGVPVDAVAQGRSEGIFPSGIPLPLLIQVRLNVINKGPAVLGPIMGMDSQPGPLVHQDDLVILIDDAKSKGCENL